jgi:hypothetical protein
VREERKLTEEDLRHWKLLERFQEVLKPVAAKSRMHPTFSDPRRTLGYASYLSLFLFGLFNPVVQSMRQLCAISELERVRQAVGCGKVSLGSFSETQGVLDPDLLQQVFERLAEQMPASGRADPRLGHLELIVQDGSLWRALPHMSWAEYGVGPKGQAKGMRLHLRFNLLKDCPEDALLTEGKGSETEALRQMLLPGQTTVADRLYGQSYKLFQEIDAHKAFFVFRISEQAVIQVEEERPVSPEERAAGILRHAWVRLGATPALRSMRLRLVEVRRDGQHLLLVTNHSVETLSAELVSLVYRKRWSIELFFRWIKCILGTRHFFAESREGAALQIYLALIAGLLLQLFTGERPNKRVMELLQLYFLGWATAEELARLIPKYSAKAPLKKSAAR